MSRYTHLAIRAMLAMAFVFCPALASAGYIAAWGRNDLGQCNSPAGNDYVDIIGLYDRGLALKSDGSIVNWGRQPLSTWHVPEPAGTFTEIDGFYDHVVAIQTDGSLADWGYDYFGQCTNTPTGNNFIDVSAGGYSNLALKSDNSIGSSRRFFPQSVTLQRDRCIYDDFVYTRIIRL